MVSRVKKTGALTSEMFRPLYAMIYKHGEEEVWVSGVQHAIDPQTVAPLW